MDLNKEFKFDWCVFGFHSWSQWKDIRKIDVYETTFGEAKYPIRTELVQEKRCKNCNQMKSRKAIC